MSTNVYSKRRFMVISSIDGQVWYHIYTWLLVLD